MAKAKLSLSTVATFAATAAIPIPGGKAVDVEFQFKWMSRNDFKEWLLNLAGAEDVDALMDILAGWELDEPFNKEQVEKLVQKFSGAARPILDKFIAELSGARAKN